MVGLVSAHLLMTPTRGHFPYFLSGVELKPNLPAGLKLPVFLMYAANQVH